MTSDDSEEFEEFESVRYPQPVLFAIWLLYYYMNRTPGKPRPALMYSAWVMAARILGLHGANNQWSLPDYADERLRRFGLEPTTHQVIDKKRWAIAWNIINRHQSYGCPWRIQSEVFEKEYDEAMRRGGDIPDAAPVTFTRKRAKNRPRKEAWDVKKFKPKEEMHPTFYRPRNVFQSRVQHYMRELEES
jgi:hypothetical protein